MIDFCGNHAFGLSSEEKNHSLYIKFGVTSVCKDTNYFGYMVACCGFFGVWNDVSECFLSSCTYLLWALMTKGLFFLNMSFSSAEIVSGIGDKLIG
ncbi:hypothetical protein HMPREF9969_2472 [Prevotella sp. oral taxon 306 str. F0472]|nr:hypothetical protein HMPREF9969_2472 [Prevotella sp. oral taxon 306 str. F0472]